MYQGSASYLWENFDAVFLDALIDKTVEIEKEINKDSGVSSDKYSQHDQPVGKYNINNLEDSPCSEEQRAKFLEIMALTEQQNAEKRKGRKLSGNKLVDNPVVAATIKQLEKRIK